MALRWLKNTRIGLIYFWFSLLHGVPIIVSYYVLIWYIKIILLMKKKLNNNDDSSGVSTPDG